MIPTDFTAHTLDTCGNSPEFGQVFRCARCHALRCYCEGCDDHESEVCDECAMGSGSWLGVLGVFALCGALVWLVAEALGGAW